MPLARLKVDFNGGLSASQKFLKRLGVLGRQILVLTLLANLNVHAAGFVVTDIQTLRRNRDAADVTGMDRFVIFVVNHEIKTRAAAESKVKLNVNIIETEFGAIDALDLAAWAWSPATLLLAWIGSPVLEGSRCLLERRLSKTAIPIVAIPVKAAEVMFDFSFDSFVLVSRGRHTNSIYLEFFGSHSTRCRGNTIALKNPMFFEFATNRHECFHKAFVLICVIGG